MLTKCIVGFIIAISSSTTDRESQIVMQLGESGTAYSCFVVQEAELVLCDGEQELPTYNVSIIKLAKDVYSFKLLRFKNGQSRPNYRVTSAANLREKNQLYIGEDDRQNLWEVRIVRCPDASL